MVVIYKLTGPTAAGDYEVAPVISGRLCGWDRAMLGLHPLFEGDHQTLRDLHPPADRRDGQGRPKQRKAAPGCFPHSRPQVAKQPVTGTIHPTRHSKGGCLAFSVVHPV